MDDLNEYTRVTPQERAELTALCTEYAWRADNYRSETIPELFLDDATWEGTGTLMNGRKELIAGWKARALLEKEVVRRHMITNLRFVKDSDGGIRGWTTFCFLKRPIGENAQPVLELIGEWVDTYARNARGTWLFKTRQVAFLFPDNWFLPTPELADECRSTLASKAVFWLTAKTLVPRLRRATFVCSKDWANFRPPLLFVSNSLRCAVNWKSLSLNC